MKTFEVRLSGQFFAGFEIEAENEEIALEKAKESLTSDKEIDFEIYDCEVS